jgi:hypothetical protein
MGLAPIVAAAEEAMPRIHAGVGIGGIFSEIRGGAMSHDIGDRERGANINVEMLFVTPVPHTWTAEVARPARWVLEPRPHVGFSANTAGGTSKGYFGLTWTAVVARDLLQRGDGIRFDIFAGGSVNNGNHGPTERNRSALGGNLLFRLGVELGYQIDPRWSISVYFDHDSNAYSARYNGGLNSLGLRVGYAL